MRATHSLEYVITERGERLGAAKNKIFDAHTLSSEFPHQARLSKWPGLADITAGDAVGYQAGKLWHKEVPDQPVEAESEE